MDDGDRFWQDYVKGDFDSQVVSLDLRNMSTDGAYDKVVKAMAKEYEGIPREMIPWWPTLNYDKCIGCQECYNFCPHGVYDWDEENSRPVVARRTECDGMRQELPFGGDKLPPQAGDRFPCQGAEGAS